MNRRSLASRTAVALVHHPVCDRNGSVITAAVTNLDIHDIARVSRTFGLCRYFLVTPVEEQAALVRKIRSHWTEGWGAGYNPKRGEALSTIETVPTVESAVETMRCLFAVPPLVVATGASHGRPSVTVEALLGEAGDRPLLLLFGTGWGLAPPLFDRADRVLEPIRGVDRYNHLPVRSAVSIYLDRMFGCRQ